MGGQRAPRTFLVLLFIGFMLSFGFSQYMEGRHLGWLQAHPISVNLISGVVGFCGGFLTLAIVYNWFVERDTLRRDREKALANWRAVCQPLSDALGELFVVARAMRDPFPGKEARDSTVADATLQRDRLLRGLDLIREHLKVTQPVVGLDAEAIQVPDGLDSALLRVIASFNGRDGVEALRSLLDDFAGLMRALSAEVEDAISKSSRPVSRGLEWRTVPRDFAEPERSAERAGGAPTPAVSD
jgi:hypothetical protein